MSTYSAGLVNMETQCAIPAYETTESTVVAVYHTNRQVKGGEIRLAENYPALKCTDLLWKGSCWMPTYFQSIYPDRRICCNPTSTFAFRSSE
jgi:hypothetical protein